MQGIGDRDLVHGLGARLREVVLRIFHERRTPIRPQGDEGRVGARTECRAQVQVLAVPASQVCTEAPGRKSREKLRDERPWLRQCMRVCLPCTAC